jgi:hypothetical protein
VGAPGRTGDSSFPALAPAPGAASVPAAMSRGACAAWPAGGVAGGLARVAAWSADADAAWPAARASASICAQEEVDRGGN